MNCHLPQRPKGLARWLTRYPASGFRRPVRLRGRTTRLSCPGRTGELRVTKSLHAAGVSCSRWFGLYSELRGSGDDRGGELVRCLGDQRELDQRPAARGAEEEAVRELVILDCPNGHPAERPDDQFGELLPACV